jgi:hypothetical protein
MGDGSGSGRNRAFTGACVLRAGVVARERLTVAVAALDCFADTLVTFLFFGGVVVRLLPWEEAVCRRRDDKDGFLE